DIFDSQPAPTAPVLENTGGPSQLLRRLNRSRVYSWSLGATVPEVIAFSFGFTPRTVNRAALASALILLIPILFVSWLGRKALSAPESDRAAVWFSYMRYLQWSLSGSLIGWWTVTEPLHLVPLLKFFSTGWTASLWNFPVTAIIVDWVPPCLV